MLEAVVKSAAKRALADPRRTLSAAQLLNAHEAEQLAEALAAANATADLLARVRVRERQERAAGAKGLHKHGDDQPFEVFAGQPIEPLPPEQALAYFRGLTPTLGVDPQRFGPDHRRQAFTLAKATDTVLLGKVQTAIREALTTGKGGTPDVQDVLDRAGVSSKNPQYADMVFRTNAMDAYNVGANEELQQPDVQEMFPVWKYLGINDGRQGKDHEPNFDKYFASSLSFVEVRGPRPWNCRCTFSPVDKFEWADLQAKGERAKGYVAPKPPPAKPAPPAPAVAPTPQPPAREPEPVPVAPPPTQESPRPASAPSPFPVPDVSRQRTRAELASVTDAVRHTAASVTEAGAAALREYTAGEYKRINAELRAGVVSDRHAGAVEVLRAATEFAPALDEPVVTYRGIGISSDDLPAFKAMIADARASGVLEMAGFTSTSFDVSVALKAAARGDVGLMFEIAVRKGLAVDAVVDSGEKEFLLPAGAKFRVVGTKKVTVGGGKTRTVIQLEQIV